MWVKVGAAQSWKMFEAADDAPDGQTFEIGLSHLCHQLRVGAEGTVGQAGVIGVGQHIYNGHEVDIQAQRGQVFGRVQARVIGDIGITRGSNGRF